VADYYGLDKSLINPSQSQPTSSSLPSARLITGFIIEKAKRDLGYNPHSFEEGIAMLEKQIAKS
jgi:dTDP-4-dehydrorhamnose reductase